MAGLFQAIAGAVAVTAGALAATGTLGALTPLELTLAKAVISAGAGMVLSGVGTLIAGNHQKGFATTEKNPIAPWRFVYGHFRVGGSLVFDNEWGDSNKMRDMVIVLAAHSCQGGPPNQGQCPILLFDNQRIQIDATGGTCNTNGTTITWVSGTKKWKAGADLAAAVFSPGCLVQIAGQNYVIQSVDSPTQMTLTYTAGTQSGVSWFGGGSAPVGALPGSGTSFSPKQQKVPITSISRSGDVVTVVLSQDIPYLMEGDRIQILDAPGGSDGSGLTVNGIFMVEQIISRIPSGGTAILTFTFLSGGPTVSIANAGYVQTLWADYGPKVYIEPLVGNQAFGQTFVANRAGTPYDANMKNFVLPSFPNGLGGDVAPGNDPWTNDCSLQGKTAVFLRLHYNDQKFPNGLPQISFILWGKNDVYIANACPPSYGYTENAVLCIADFLHGGASQWAPWDPHATYAAGQAVSYKNVDYYSVTSGNLNNQPDTRPSDWIAITGSTLPVAFALSATYGLGAIVSDVYLNKFLSIIPDNTGNQPSISPSAWVALPNLIQPLVPWGYGAQYGSDIPLDHLITAANVCDERVDLASGQTEPKYACNGTFTLDEKRGAILQDLLASCAGRLASDRPPFVIQPGYWQGPSSPPLSLDLAAISAGECEWRPHTTITELYNGVKGTYISQANHWQASDFPYYAQDAFHGYDGPPQYQGDINVPLDNGQRRWLDIHLRYVISPSQAQRVAKIELLRRRHFGTGTFTLNMTAFQLAQLDVFLATFFPLGWTSDDPKQLEVQKVRLTQGRSSDGSPILAVSIDVQETDSNIYVWSIDEELSAAGFQQATPPVQTAYQTVPYGWSPGYATITDGDALYPQGHKGPASFGVEPAYNLDAAGNQGLTLQIKGHYPINLLDEEIFAPLVTAVGFPDGGNLPSGTYILAVSAFDAGALPYKNTKYLNLCLVTIPETSPPSATGSMEITVDWSSGDDTGDLYMARQSLNAIQGGELQDRDQYEARGIFHLQQSVPEGDDGMPTVFTLTDFTEGTPGGPDTQVNHFAVIWQQLIHGGIWAQQVQKVEYDADSGYSTITIGGDGMTDDMYKGRTLSLLAKYALNTEVPILNMPVIASTASQGTPPEFTVTIGPNSNGDQLPDLTGQSMSPPGAPSLAVGDLVMMRYQATFTDTSFTDPLTANPYYPDGADPNQEAGRLAVVLTGADAGDVQPLSGSSGGDTFNLAGTWKVRPADGDIVIIVAPSTEPEQPTPAFVVPNKFAVGPLTSPPTAKGGVIAQPKVNNLAWLPWFFQVRTENKDGDHLPDFMAPWREIFIFGSGGTRTVNAFDQSGWSQLPTDGKVLFDTSGGDIVFQLLDLTTVPNLDLWLQKISTDTNTVTILTVDGQTIDGQTEEVLSAQWDKVVLNGDGQV